MPQIQEDYYEYLCSLIDEPLYFDLEDYSKLLSHLYEEEFIWEMHSDGNRASDGEELRYKFGRRKGWHASEVNYHIDTRPCSILEMMVGLADRCETQIMADPMYGNRTAMWFRVMLENLGLFNMTDSNYDVEYVYERLSIFLNREYDSNGRGGLFTVENPRADMRMVDIWYQMNWYLSETY